MKPKLSHGVEQDKQTEGKEPMKRHQKSGTHKNTKLKS